MQQLNKCFKKSHLGLFAWCLVGLFVCLLVRSSFDKFCLHKVCFRRVCHKANNQSVCLHIFQHRVLFLFDDYVSSNLRYVFYLSVFINREPSIICVLYIYLVLTVSMSEFTQREEFPIQFKEITSTDYQYIRCMHSVYIF